MTTYRDLVVWQRGIELVKAVYEFTATLPSSERYGLSAQLQRAAVSIPSNVAEGHGRRSRAAYMHHVSIAGLHRALNRARLAVYSVVLLVPAFWYAISVVV